jgi:hypothetical protein
MTVAVRVIPCLDVEGAAGSETGYGDLAARGWTLAEALAGVSS